MEENIVLGVSIPYNQRVRLDKHPKRADSNTDSRRLKFRSEQTVVQTKNLLITTEMS